MALNINEKMKVKTLKADFKEEFGLNIKIYDGRGFADDNATLASIRKATAIYIEGDSESESDSENSLKELTYVKVVTDDEGYQTYYIYFMNNEYDSYSFVDTKKELYGACCGPEEFEVVNLHESDGEKEEFIANTDMFSEFLDLAEDAQTLYLHGDDREFGWYVNDDVYENMQSREGNYGNEIKVYARDNHKVFETLSKFKALDGSYADLLNG